MVTGPAVAEKDADVEPCATVTLAGTLTTPELELESEIETPPLPAADVRLTVPAPDWPLTRLAGLTETLLSTGEGGLTVSPNVSLTPE